MKKTLLAIITLSTSLLLACGSGSSNKEVATSDVAVSDTTNNSSIVKSETEHAMLGVKGNCEMCKENIEKAAKSVDGVASADWDIEKKELHVNFDPKLTNLDSISKAIAKVGYTTDKDQADAKAYEALPACCKYNS